MTTQSASTYAPTDPTEKGSTLLGSIDLDWSVSALGRPLRSPPAEVFNGDKVEGPLLFDDQFVSIVPRAVAPQSPEERERRVAEYIMTHSSGGTGSISIRAVQQATGIPRATIGKLETWRVFAEWRRTSREGKLRTRLLTDEMLAVVRSNANNPVDIAAANELESLIRDQLEDGSTDYYLPDEETIGDSRHR